MVTLNGILIEFSRGSKQNFFLIIKRMPKSLLNNEKKIFFTLSLISVDYKDDQVFNKIVTKHQLNYKFFL